MLSSKVIFVCVAAATLCFVSGEQTNSLGEEFALIEEHLVKNVQTADVEANLAEALNWLEKKDSKSSFLLKKKSQKPVEALRLLAIELPSVLNEGHVCRKNGRQILMRCNAALRNGYYSGTMQTRRVDKIVQHYAFEFAKACPQELLLPLLDIAYGEKVYEVMDKYFADHVGSKDIKDHMDKARKWAEWLLKFEDESDLLNGVRQLLALEKTVTPDSCNAEGSELGFKNLLGTSFRASSGERRRRRIDKIVKYYLDVHASVCLNTYPKRFSELLKQVPEESVKAVETIVGSYLKSKFESYQGPISFSTIEPSTSGWVDSMKPSEMSYNFSIVSTIKSEVMYEALLELAGNDPNRKYLKEEVNKDEFRRLYKKYLLKPCNEYNTVVMDEVFQPLDKDLIQLAYNQNELNKDQFISVLPLQSGHLGAAFCMFVQYGPETLINEMVEIANHVK